MRYGISLPNAGECDARAAGELAHIAEAAGWDAIFLEDYIVYQGVAGMPTHDPWVMLAAMALRTERILLGTTVTPLARRRPWKVAREAVTLDHFSNGRLILGVGSGVSEEQSFAAFGVEQCYQFHGYTLNNVTQVSLPGGITGQALAYNSQQYGSWTIVYWILPVKRGANNVYERVVLYVQNAHGVVAAATHSDQAGVQADAQGANPQQLVQLRNEGFLEAYAREMIDDQANQSSAVFAKHSVA